MTPKYHLSTGRLITLLVAFLVSLYFPKMHWRRNDIADPANSTRSWIFGHPDYLKWLSQRHGALVGQRKPWSRKVGPHETSSRDDRARPKPTGDICLVLLSWPWQSNPENALGLFRSLIHQIAQQIPEILSDLTSSYKKKCEVQGQFGEKWDWHEGDLRRIFKIHIADVARTYRIQLYIDALDECGEEVAIDLVEFFEHAGALLNICFSCRHYPLIALESGVEICVEGENLKDVLTYIAGSVQNRVLTIEVADVLINDIAMKASGNFQWATLVVPKVLQLRRKRKPLASLQASIRKIPSELGELY